MEWVGDLERAFATAIYPNRVLIAVLGVMLIVAIGAAARRGRWDRVARRRPLTTECSMSLQSRALHMRKRG